MTTASSSAPAVTGQKNSQAGLIFANRYKTKLCRQYAEDPATGVATCSCPYKKKCMFAHDRAELRTPEQNLADGILTKEDIRTFNKRCRALKREQAMPDDTAAASSATATSSHNRSLSSRSQSSASSHSAATFIPIECPNHRRPYTTQEVSQGFYTHSPYGQRAATPTVPSTALGWNYNIDCKCAQCASHHWQPSDNKDDAENAEVYP